MGLQCQRFGSLIKRRILQATYVHVEFRNHFQKAIVIALGCGKAAMSIG